MSLKHPHGGLTVVACLLMALTALAFPEAQASAAPLWSSLPKPFKCNDDGGIVANNSCLKHTGFKPNAGTGHVTPWWGQYRNRKGNCTAYVAYRLIKNGASNFLVPGKGSAYFWREHAENNISKDAANDTPAVGAVAWYQFGHVAYVEKVSANGRKVYLSESHWQTPSSPAGSRRLVVSKGSRYWPDKFLHIKDPPSNPLRAFIGTIVQWKDDEKAQKTAWLVGGDLKRRWIPDIATYQCLKARGARGPIQLSARVLDKLKDLSGVHAACSPPPADLRPSPTPSPPRAPEPEPLPEPSSSPQPRPKPKPKPKPTPSPSVAISKGASAQGMPGCRSVYCRYIVVKFKNFSGGGHSITCRASHGSEGGYYTYTRSGSVGTSAYCYYGYPGHTVWVTVDGVSSNRVRW